MLIGIQAFEACWIDLTSHHPTTKDDNTVIAHAMGQLIDRYETPMQIEQALPDHLKRLFRELATAYFRGYQPLIPAAVVPLAPTGSRSMSAGSQSPEISAAVEKVRALAKHNRCSLNPARAHCCSDNPNEAETLIIEFPEGWPTCSHPDRS